MSHSRRSIPLSGFSARVQVDPCAITADAVDADRVAVFRVNGVRCPVRVLKMRRQTPQSGAIHTLIKNHSVGFFCGHQNERGGPIKEMELTRNPLFSATGEARLLWGWGDGTHLEIAKAFLRSSLKQSTPCPFLHYHCRERLIWKYLLLFFPFFFFLK